MARFLIRDFDNTAGYVAITRPSDGKGKGWSQREGYVPWVVTADGKVIYAKLGAHRGPPPFGTDWSKYNMENSKERRRLCQSEFGQHALDWRFVGDAVARVSAGVLRYLRAHETPEAIEFLSSADGFAHYLYTDRGSFGRLGEVKPSNKETVWRNMIAALATTNTKPEQHLAIHDAVGRKMLEAKWKDKPYIDTYAAIMAIVRPDWYDLKEYRGRKERLAKAKQTTVSGVVRSATGMASIATRAAPVQSRIRGVDSFEFQTPALRSQASLDADYALALERWYKGGEKGDKPVREMFDLTLEERRLAESMAYYDDLDERNLLFGAGPSGTTGTLMAAAMTFGGMAHGDDRLKQYAMAIAGYLVGGGMHSYHEEMTVAARVGVPYAPGSYLGSLPDSFLSSDAFVDWNGEYYDIVTIGGIHWVYAKDDLIDW